MSERVARTLEALLVPGNRYRLSPFIESTQLQVLFKESPDDRHRAESIRAILQRPDVQQTIDELARQYEGFARKGKKFFEQGTYHGSFLAMYLAYYTTVHAPKLQLLLLELVRLGKLRGELRVLDIGTGPGTTALALFDFLLLWETVCRFWDEPFPVTGVRLIGLDRSQEALEYAQRVSHAFADRVEAWLAARQALPRFEWGTRDDPGALEWARVVVRSARDAVWHRVDLTSPEGRRAACDLCQDSSLVVASYVLSELRAAKVERALSEILRNTQRGTIALVLEAGNRDGAQGLMRWRRGFLKQAPAWRTLLPCGQEFGTSLPEHCVSCWPARRQALAQPELYRMLVERISSFERNPDRFDEVENELLSWSYVVLEHDPMTASAISAEYRSGNTRLVQGPGQRTGRVARMVGSWLRKPGASDWLVPALPADCVPQSGQRAVSQEEYFLKLCPAHLGTPCRPVLIPVSRWNVQHRLVRYGELLHLDELKWEEKEGNFLYNGTWRRFEDPAAGNYGEPGQLGGSASGQWSGAMRGGTALDDLAYRLFGFLALRPFQRRVIDRVLRGQSTLAIAATGSGKSECFILPALLMPGFTVVVSPLKSLMQDQFEQRLRNRYGVDQICTFINGDIPVRERDVRLKLLELGYWKLVYITPEQLERDWVIEAIRLADRGVPGGLRYLVFDEAHCISQWGHDFRPAYLNIVRRFRQHGLNPTIIALTATASWRVREDLCFELGLDPRPIEEGGDVLLDVANRPELNLVVRLVPDHKTKAEDILDRLLELKGANEDARVPGAAIAFLPHTGREDFVKPDPESPRVTDFAAWLEEELQENVAIYHSKMDADTADTLGLGEEEVIVDSRPRVLGEMTGRTRREEQNRFLRGDCWVMVATKGFGMGIDKPNVRLVLHRTPPSTLEAYWQEAGRAGRDGEIATAVLYFATDVPDRLAQAEPDQTNDAWSDYDIQHFFIEQRYVDTELVRLLVDYLATAPRTRVGTVYVTGDELLEFLNSRGYEFPKAGARRKYKFESEEHARILDRGHLYEHRMNYLDRALQMMLSHRPVIGGQFRTILEEVHMCSAEVRDLQVKREPKELLNLFEWLAPFRQRFKDDPEWRERFCTLFERDRQCLFLDRIAELFGLTLHEALGLLHDFRKADGYFAQTEPLDAVTGRGRVRTQKNTRWVSNVLDFKSVVPLRGSAKGKEGLEAWLEYAGACKRASKEEAQRRAQSRGRQSPERTDWFGWSEAASRRGWEIRLGDAFAVEGVRQEIVEAFITHIERRKQYDWENYHRLLSDYVGVEHADGRWRPRTGQLPCLRAVMLGYLDTGETVVGDNCLSCSRCLPELTFSNDLEERKRRVTRLSADLVELLFRLEGNSREWPEPEILDRLADFVERERQQHRQVEGYLLGWTDRLLTETPGHRAAVSVRFFAACRGWIELSADELRQLARQLIEL